jgi:hypothetical protein
MIKIDGVCVNEWNTKIYILNTKCMLQQVSNYLYVPLFNSVPFNWSLTQVERDNILCGCKWYYCYLMLFYIKGNKTCINNTILKSSYHHNKLYEC